MKIFLDLDGVIINCTKKVCEATHHPYPSQTVFSNYHWLADQIGHSTFYKVARGYDFWANMEAFPWSYQLISIVREHSEGNWCFLTRAIYNDVHCFSGKSASIKKHFPKCRDKLTICSGDKGLYASPDAVLIDDSNKNIDRFSNFGGKGFLWKEMTDDVGPKVVQERMEQVKKFLTDLQK